MYIFIILVITLIAILICISVLLQAGKGGGLAGIGGGGQATQVLGARQAPDFLEKATWMLGTAFIVLCVLANFFAAPSEQRRSILEGAETPIEQPLPGGPGTMQDQFLPPAGPGDVAPAPGEGQAPADN
jgi:preprotein translocase subunit SecG